MEETLKPKNEELASPPTVQVYVDPAILMLAGVGAGFLYGALMVALDPIFRFPDAPIYINWREMLLTASMVGAYGAVLGWVLTSFWRRWQLWGMTLFITPIVAGVVALWNNINAAFGTPSDFLIFLPFTLVFNLMSMGLSVLYLLIVVRHPRREKLALATLPMILAIIVFLGIARLRWANADAQDMMSALDQYAEGILQNDDYSIELLSIRYRGEIAPTGDAIIRTEEQRLACRVRLFPQNIDVSCIPQE